MIVPYCQKAISGTTYLCNKPLRHDGPCSYAPNRRSVQEAVNHPVHYGGDDTYEVIKVLEAWSLEGAWWFCWGNAIKYLGRRGQKGGSPPLRDLQKAAWYVERAADIQRRLDERH